MEKTTILKAGDLAPAARAWVGSVLQMELTDHDVCEFTVRRSVRIPTPEERAEWRRRLAELLRQFQTQVQPASEEEIDAAVEEAVRYARSKPI